MKQKLQHSLFSLIIVFFGLFFILGSEGDGLPVITILGDNPVTVKLGDSYVDAGATAKDAKGRDINVITTGLDLVNTAIAKTYAITYTATDQDGNKATAIRDVIVKSSAVTKKKNTIEFTVKTGSQINIDDISTVVTYPVTIKGNTATWEQPFWDFFEDKGRYNSNQIAKGDLIFSFTVNKNGIISVQTKSPDKNDHLFVFLNGNGLAATEYNPMSTGWLYTASKQLYKKLGDNNLLSGNILSDDKAFAAAAMAQKNYFQEDITIIMSRLAHHQMDYSWITKKTVKWQIKQNAKWSPIASKPDQNAHIARSFTINNKTAASGAFYILAWADNRMTSQTKVEGLKNIDDYSYDYHGDILQCDSTEGWCKAWNENCCAISMINKGSIPTKVTMNAYTTWSNVQPAVVIATFGNITTSNHTETPSHDDGNPAPLRFVLPSEKKTDSFLFKKTSQKIAYGADYNQACINAFGTDWHLADWTDLKQYFSSGKDMNQLVSRLSLNTNGDDSAAWVTRNGDKSYSARRDYYMSYHNHKKPSHYLAHDNIDNYYLSLGSWDSPHYALCIETK
jgi:hypothetical protein